MKSLKFYFFLWILIESINISCQEKSSADQESPRTVFFDNNWKFLRDSITGPEHPDFNDSSWRTVDLPHDWSIEDLPGPENESQIGPFSKNSPGGVATGWVMGGTGWYRKHFTMDPADTGKIFYIHFDGIYMESDVWVNGRHTGFHPYGYTPFYYDITHSLNPPGADNVISIRVQNTGKNSRWYSGSGIYRHVAITKVDPLHILPWGVFVTTPEVSRERATIKFKIDVINEQTVAKQFTLETRISGPDGQTVKTISSKAQISEEMSSVFEQQAEIPHPALWSLNTPFLYTARVIIRQGNKISEGYETTFGIRKTEFSAGQGFLLNGEPVEMKGACMHHDNGLLGAAAFDAAEERRVRIMKNNGFNAIRTSHNPPSKTFLDACDRVGMLVIDEAFDQWELPKNPYDYHRYFPEWWKKDLESMVLRDRNHPSVIIWSIGNEIRERADTTGIETGKKLKAAVKDLDPTRPVTNAICHFWDNPGKTWEDTGPAFAILDIGGYNYQYQQYEPDHRLFPERIMMGTESVPQHAWENWKLVIESPWVIGDFVWTGMDYLGEVGIGHTRYLKKGEKSEFSMPWPWFNAWCGDIDITGNKKPQMFYRDVIWGNSLLEIAVHPPVPDGTQEVISYWGWYDEYQSWNWAGKEGKLFTVTIYSSLPEVRLELNGKMIGKKSVPDSAGLKVRFEIPWEAGELKATGLKDGKEIVSKSLITTGKPSRIRLIAEQDTIRADLGTLAFVRVEVMDEDYRLIPDAAIPFRIRIEGEGVLIAAGNGSPNEMTSFKKPESKTYQGKALIIIRSNGQPGKIIISSEADGIGSSSVAIESVK